MKIKSNGEDEWLITCQHCDYQWYVYSEKETKNLECPRCGYNRCSILKEDPELVKKRGRIIGYVEYDPIKDEFGDCYDVDEEGNMHKK